MVRLAAYRGIIKDAIPVIATIMIIGAETIPADVAAWPMMRAPTMLTAEPTCFGSLTPASRSASKEISIINASTSAGNGISSLALAMLRSSTVGIIS
ncbi:hypothetical protein D3C73_1456780 [compost metagenome]